MKTLVRVMASMLITSFLGCSQGWSVGGYQITPRDTVTNMAFIEVMGIDSSLHYYHNKIYETQNWCWIHNQFEDVNYE